MGDYGQFCPIAKAMEVLDQRWTMLIMREIVTGSMRFNEIRRGVPKMSPALLSTRLRQLQRVGLVDRLDHNGGIEYRPTPAGRELREVLETIGRWGIRWIGELGDHELDPHLLMWDMRRRVAADALPRGRTVLAIEFTDVPSAAAHWWMILDPSETNGVADVCDFDPGFEVDVWLTCRLRALIDVWLGSRSWVHAQREGEIEVDGRRSLIRAVPAWFRLSIWVDVPRPTDVSPVAPLRPAG